MQQRFDEIPDGVGKIGGKLDVHFQDWLAEKQLLVGSWVRNGTSKPGEITDIVELKPGYPRAWVKWEGSNFPVAEDFKGLKLIEPASLEWQWNDKDQFVRSHDRKKCHELKVIARELEKLEPRLITLRSRNDLEIIQNLEAKIAHLKRLKVSAVVIDGQFPFLLPPLSEDEERELRGLLKEEGCRDALVFWGNVLLDGHHRFDLCKKLGIDFPLSFLEFKDRKEAHDWIIQTHVARRNLSQEWLSNLRGEMYRATKQSHGGDRKSEESSGKSYHLKNEDISTEKSSGKSYHLKNEDINTEKSSGKSYHLKNEDINTEKSSGKSYHLKNEDINTEKSSGKSYHLKNEDISTEESSGKSYHLKNEDINTEESHGKTAKELAAEFGVSEKTIRNDGKYAEASDKICYNFGQEWRETIINSKLTRSQVKEIAKYVEDDEVYDEIEAVLSNVSHGDDFKENYQIFKDKIKPPVKLIKGQLVKIKLKYKSGLTTSEKHCAREYGLILEVLEHSYKIKLLSYVICWLVLTINKVGC